MFVCKAINRHSNRDLSTENSASIILKILLVMCKMAIIFIILLPRLIPVDIHKSGKLRKKFR